MGRGGSIGSHRNCVICGKRERQAKREHNVPHLYFFRLPNDEDRCREWVRVIGNEDLVHVPIEKLHQLRHVCSDHFDRRQLNRKGNRLRKYAVPILLLSAPPLTDEQLREFPLHVAVKRTKKKTVLPFSIMDHDYCSLDEPSPYPNARAHPTLAELDPLPVKEEESFSPEINSKNDHTYVFHWKHDHLYSKPLKAHSVLLDQIAGTSGSGFTEPMACDVDDPLGSPRNDSPTEFEDEGAENESVNPEQVLKPIVRQAVPVSNVIKPLPNQTKTPYNIIRQVTLVDNEVRLPQNQQQVSSKPSVRQVSPVNTQMGLQQNPQPPTATTATKLPYKQPDKQPDWRPPTSKREKQLLARLQAVKKELNKLRKRVKQIDRITSPVLKTIIEAAIHNHRKKAKGVRWTPLHKTVAVKLYRKSPPTYKYLQELLPMPSVRTLNALINNSLLKPEEDPDGGETKPVANTSFRDIVVNELNETDDAVRTISLTTPQSMEDNLDKLRKHIGHLNSVILRLQTQNKLLKERVSSFGKNHELNKVVENMTPAAQVFTRMQYIQTPKKPGSRQYSPEEKVLTVSMYNSSPTGYAALSNFFTLPSEELIEKFARQVQKGLLKSLETNEEIGGLKSLETNEVIEGSNENVAADENRPPAKRKRGGGHGGSGRGGGRLKHMRKINLHDPLPPPARLVAAPSASSNAGIHNFDENFGYYLPTVHSTVDVSTEGETVAVVNSSYYQRSLDMAIAGLTTDMRELD